MVTVVTVTVFVRFLAIRKPASNIYASCIEHLRYVPQTYTICVMHIYASYIAHLGSLHARYRLLAWSGAYAHIVSIGISQCQKPMETTSKATHLQVLYKKSPSSPKYKSQQIVSLKSTFSIISLQKISKRCIFAASKISKRCKIWQSKNLKKVQTVSL